jgi:hypothetical protein
MTARFGRGKSALVSHRTDLKGPFLWPHPAKEKAFRVWRSLGANYDALGEGVTHVFPADAMTAKAYVLGRHWTVYDPRTGLHTSPQRKDVSTLDLAPVVDVYGRDLPDGGRAGIDENATDALQRLVVRDLSRFGLDFTVLSVEAVPGRPRVVATIRFTEAAYGAGEDWIRIRCVAPDGTELGPVGYSH